MLKQKHGYMKKEPISKILKAPDIYHLIDGRFVIVCDCEKSFKSREDYRVPDRDGFQGVKGVFQWYRVYRCPKCGRLIQVDYTSGLPVNSGHGYNEFGSGVHSLFIKLLKLFLH